MNVSNARARIELLANTSPAADTEPNVANELAIGLPILTQRFPTATVAYSTRFLIATGSTGVINLTTNVTSASDAFVAGTAQRETATAAGTITLAGNATVVFTSSNVTGSPITLNVPVALNDTASQWAEKVRVALAANTAIAARFAISGTGTSIIADALPEITIAGIPFRLANNSTLNISLANGTCTGITTAATSANTTAGVVTSGCKVIGGGGLDVWGDALPACLPVAVLLSASNAAGNVMDLSDTGNDEIMQMRNGAIRLLTTSGEDQAAIFGDTLTIDATSGIGDLTITVIGLPEI